MKILEQVRSVQQRLISLLLTLVCLLGLVPTTAFAAATSVPSTITMEDCTHNGVHYESPALDTCWLHQMRFDYSGNSIIGFVRITTKRWAGPWKDISGIVRSRLTTLRSRS